jgi:hypothetical protein
MLVNGINFSEVVEELDVIDVHDREVEVLGYDEDGNEYSAVGMESDGELVDVYEDTVESKPYVPEGTGWDVDVDEDGPFITISNDF